MNLHYDIAVIGPTPLDNNYRDGQLMERAVGGGTYHTGIALARLGVKTAIFTPLADSPDTSLVDKAFNHPNIVEVFPTPSAENMVFENYYYSHNPDKRRQQMVQSSDPIQKDDLNTSIYTARIIHLAPLTKRDLPVPTVQALATDFERTLDGKKPLISLAVQGYVRKNINGKIFPDTWGKRDRILPYIDIIAMDAAESYYLQPPQGLNLSRYLAQDKAMRETAESLLEKGIKEVIITLGSRGSLIACNAGVMQIPAYSLGKITNPTGAGDSFVAGYLSRRLVHEDPFTSARFAAITASNHITGKAYDSPAIEQALHDWQAQTS